MRSLSAALLAAQKAASGVPYLRTIVTRTVRQVRHLVWAQTFSDSAPDDPHGAAGDNPYLHRIRVDSTGQPQYERDAGAGWQSIHPPITTATVCAIAAKGDARVINVWNEGAAIYMQESTNQGGSYGAKTLVTTAGATPKALAVAYKAAGGDLAIFWEESNNLKRIRRSGGTFGSITTWTQSAHSINGLAVTYDGDFLLVVTGKEVTTERPTVWSLVLGDGFLVATDTWAAFNVQAQAETDQNITFQAPSVAVVYVPRVTFVEKFAGTNAYTRTYWTMTTISGIYSAGAWEWLDPVPLDDTTNNGLAITATGAGSATGVLSRPGRVLTAPNTAQSLDMSADLVEATLDERDGLTQRAELVFDNSAGQYAGPPAPIALHRDVELGLGYDALFSKPPAQSITGWEYRKHGGRSVFVLFTGGSHYWLSLSRSRTTIVNTRKMTAIARAAAARAGLEAASSGASSRAGALDIEWTVHPQQTQLDVLRALLALYNDIIFTRTPGSILTITEPLAADSVDYTFGTDHAIYELRARDEPAPSLAEVLGDELLGQAFDFTRMNQEKPVTDRRRNPHDATGAGVGDAATARLRKAVLATDKGELVVPPHCGLEINDVVAYTDTDINASQQKARVRSITTRFRRRDTTRPVYEQRVGLGGL